MLRSHSSLAHTHNLLIVPIPPQVANRFLSQLKDANPDHPFVQDHFKKEDEFERVAKLFTAA